MYNLKTQQTKMDQNTIENTAISVVLMNYTKYNRRRVGAGFIA